MVGMGRRTWERITLAKGIQYDNQRIAVIKDLNTGVEE
jgi:hypothetical protein